MKEIKLRARAKINLTLDVVGKQENGYHLLETIMQTVSLYDGVYMKRIEQDKIVLKTNLAWLPVDEKNLAYKAALLMREKFQLKEGVFIELHKKIPVAAGLAGGSADCAAVLVGMNQLFSLKIPRHKLEEIGASLGSDIPYCIRRGTVFAQGIGNQLQTLPNSPFCFILLAKLPISVSTVMVYQSLEWDKIKHHPNNQKMLEAIKNQDIEAMAQNLGNVLEDVTIKMYPEIGVLKETLLNAGAMGACMSGSGPTVFGLFKDKEQANIALSLIHENHHLKEAFITTIFPNHLHLTHQQKPSYHKPYHYNKYGHRKEYKSYGRNKI